MRPPHHATTKLPVVQHSCTAAPQAIPRDYSSIDHGGVQSRVREETVAEETSSAAVSQQQPMDAGVIWLSVLIVPVSVLTLLLVLFLAFHVYLCATGESTV